MTGPSRTLRELPTLLLLLVVGALMAAPIPDLHLPGRLGAFLASWHNISTAFRSPGNLTTLGQNAAFIGIMACGEGLVILSGGLDLSVGSILALASCLTAMALAANWAWPLAALAGLAAGALAGAFNGAFITYRRQPPILTTLATLLLFRYGVSILSHARNYGPFPAEFNRIGAGWTPAVLFVLVTALFVVAMLRTPFGRWAIAVGGSELAARLSGVPVDRVKRATYLLSGLCAGLAGLITMAFNNNTQSTAGQGYELDVIAACVVGGVRITGGDGTVLGAALGALLIALLRDALILTGRPVEQYGLFTGAVILAAAALEQWRVWRQERRRQASAG
ncbi:MAG TPA: ABC transporter permease [Chthonomonadaceae bacterium]|nr:ABC transporter permease [Chthonomonadaceae bacterium]